MPFGQVGAARGRPCATLRSRRLDQDLYVSLVGGATVSEPALDLLVALALASMSWDVVLGWARWPVARCRYSVDCAVQGL